MPQYTITVTDEYDFLLAWGAEQYNAAPPSMASEGDETPTAPEPITAQGYAQVIVNADLSNRRNNALALTREVRQMLEMMPEDMHPTLLGLLNSPALAAYVQYLRQTAQPAP